MTTFVALLVDKSSLLSGEKNRTEWTQFKGLLSEMFRCFAGSASQLFSSRIVSVLLTSSLLKMV